MGFAGLATRQEGGASAGVISRRIAIGTAFVVGQTTQDQEVILVRRQGFQNVGECVVIAIASRCPVGQMYTVGDHQERHAPWRCGRLGCPRKVGLHRLQGRQRQTGADSA
jgi:hypothetical protein